MHNGENEKNRHDEPKVQGTSNKKTWVLNNVNVFVTLLLFYSVTYSLFEDGVQIPGFCFLYTYVPVFFPSYCPQTKFGAR